MTLDTATSPEALAQEAFNMLKRRMGAIRERAMRRELFGETLVKLPPAGQAELLHLVIQGSAQGTDAIALLTAFQDQPKANNQLDYEQVRDVYAAAQEKGYPQVQRLLLVSQSNQNKPAVLKGHPSLSGTSLGMRKFMARKPNPAMLEKLLMDPDPAVIRNLLRNPRITEREVLKICSRRPNHPEVLEEVANNTKWSTRYQVKLALVQNPYAPSTVSLPLLPQLNTPHVERIAQTDNLPPQVLYMAEEVLKNRKDEPEEVFDLSELAALEDADLPFVQTFAASENDSAD